jgi:hypothetical protein
MKDFPQRNDHSIDYKSENCVQLALASGTSAPILGEGKEPINNYFKSWVENTLGTS